MIDYLNGYNSRPQAELLGLSPNQLAQLLDGDWRTVGALRLNQSLSQEQVNRSWAFPAAMAFLRLVRDHGPASATATGNLTRKFVATCLETLEFSPKYLAELREMNRVINEPDVSRLFELRITLVAAGYLRRRTGFRLTRLGRQALDAPPSEAGRIFARLFLARMGVTGDLLDQEGLVFRSPLAPALYQMHLTRGARIESRELSERLLLPHLVEHETVFQLSSLAYRWVIAPCLEFGLAERHEGNWKLGDPTLTWITPLFGEFVRFVWDAPWSKGPVGFARLP